MSDTTHQPSHLLHLKALLFIGLALSSLTGCYVDPDPLSGSNYVLNESSSESFSLALNSSELVSFVYEGFMTPSITFNNNNAQVVSVAEAAEADQTNNALSYRITALAEGNATVTFSSEGINSVFEISVKPSAGFQIVKIDAPLAHEDQVLTSGDSLKGLVGTSERTQINHLDAEGQPMRGEVGMIEVMTEEGISVEQTGPNSVSFDYTIEGEYEITLINTPLQVSVLPLEAVTDLAIFEWSVVDDSVALREERLIISEPVFFGALGLIEGGSFTLPTEEMGIRVTLDETSEEVCRLSDVGIFVIEPLMDGLCGFTLTWRDLSKRYEWTVEMPEMPQSAEMSEGEGSEG